MEDGIQIMVVKIGENEYGLDMAEIWRVVKSQTLSQPPEKNVSYIAGVISLDGSCIPVIDVHQKFGVVSTVSCRMNIILTSKRRMLAVPVDSAEWVVNVPPECCHMVPEIFQNGIGQCICMIAEFSGRLIPVIGAERLFAEVGKEIGQQCVRTENLMWRKNSKDAGIHEVSHVQERNKGWGLS